MFFVSVCLFVCCPLELLSDRTSSDVRGKLGQSSHDPPGKPGFHDGTWPLSRPHSKSAVLCGGHWPHMASEHLKWG